MKKLKLMRDYHCFPVWTYQENDPVNIDPKTLVLTSDLLKRLELWAAEFEKDINLKDKFDVYNIPEKSEATHNSEELEGLIIWKELRRQLTGRYEVYYFFSGKVLDDPSQHPLHKTAS